MDRTLFLLILSDILILSSFGLIAPILAIYINSDLTGGSVVAAGTAVGIFWVLKSIVQIPLSKVIDSRKKKTGFLIFGTFLVCLVPFIYFFARSVSHIYLAQVLYALGASMAYPAWFTLFNIHLNKKHRGFEFSIWSSGVGIGTGVSAYIGAALADKIGFRPVLLIVGIVAMMGVFTLLFIDRSYERKLVNFERKMLKIEKRIKHLKK